MNEHPLKKLQFLFRELFQFDLADLDFGIYRLFHLKQTEIETFISEQLPREVDAAFDTITGEEQERLQAELDELARQVKEQIAEDAILPTGEIRPDYLESSAKVVRELAQRYESVRWKVDAIQITEEHKAEVFNYLYDFFKRYYEDGDFIPKRHYGIREAYAVPYNGEEVFFHWANRDQHYVKTAETFKNYAFKVADLTGEYRVCFIMTKASIPKDNTKGNKRYFFPRPDLATYNTEAREFILPFEYRLPALEETERYGSNSKAQEAILEEVLPCIMEAVPDANLRALLSWPTDESGEAPTVLLKRLRHFCRRNTSDYFIHKNLAGFLTRELEFYIKDKIINLMDIEADLDAKRRVVKTFRKLAEKVIDFLATIEDAQKVLFEKKKFVLETDYLIPIRYVPQEFWPEILRNEGQLDEWRQWLTLELLKGIFNSAGEVSETFLEVYSTLPVHTQHFDRSFVRRLLEALPFEDLDEAIDGLLVHSENYQALRLLMERYREQVKCIYIDPPYNTGNDDFVYKDRYQHSSWLTMMFERISIAKNLLLRNGIHLVSIGTEEFDSLCKLLDIVFMCKCVPFVWKSRAKPTNAGDAIYRPQVVAEFVLLNLIDKQTTFYPLPSGEERTYPHRDERGNYRITTILTSNLGRYRRETMRFELAGYTPPETKRWKGGEDEIYDLYARGRIDFNEDGEPFRKIYEYDEREQHIPLWTFLPEEITGTAETGKSHLSAIVGKWHGFDSVKPVELIEVFLNATVPNGFVLDFFAGSGTTAHAVINLNREDGGRRKFILVEIDEYFNTVLLPRIAKVMYTPEWKDGKPKREATSEEAKHTPRLVKILRIESYEDTLHNLAAPSTLGRAAGFEEAYKQLVGEDAYHLRYWIELPLREAGTCLRTLDLAHPFDYSLEILTDYGPVRKPVDVVETFNYLYGLRIRRYETWRNSADGDREYRVVKATDRGGKRRILVLWRDMAGLDAETERAFLEAKVAEMEANGETWSEILINGDSPTPSVTSLDPLFKRLMMQGEEA